MGFGITSLCLLSVLLLSATACSYCTSVLREEAVAMERAGFELDCPEEQLTAKELGSSTFYMYGGTRSVIAVEGCGKTAIYEVACNDFFGCNAHLNSAIEPDRPSSALESP